MTPRALFLRAALLAAAVGGLFLLQSKAADQDTVQRDGLTYAGPELAAALESGRASGVRVVRSFASKRLECRVFVSERLSGIACRDGLGWHLRVQRDGIDFDDPAANARVEQAVLDAAAQMADQ